MPRIVKEPSARRTDIMDVAQRLVYTKGYEQMTIQDILDELHISKGAFYHYFDSKDALLEALIDRITDQVEQTISPIVNDPTLSALEKFQQYFNTAVQWKSARKPLLMALMRVWYIDENAIMRQKVLDEGYKKVRPLLSTIVHQGIKEGTLSFPVPDQAGDVIFTVMMGLSEAVVKLMLAATPEEDHFLQITNLLSAYTYALEQILGIKPGSFNLMTSEELREWLSFTEESELHSIPMQSY